MRNATLGLIALVLPIFSACGTSPPVPVEVGSIAPSFALANVNTQQTVSSESLKGDVLVLNFWSTSCAICLAEIDELNAVQADGEAQVVGIAIDDVYRILNLPVNLHQGGIPTPRKNIASSDKRQVT